MAQTLTLKDTRREILSYGRRTALALTLVLAALLAILARYFDLQIAEYESYRTQSERNRVQLQALPPKRGLIYDRHGALLAANRPSHILSLVRERVPELEATLAALGELVAVEEEDLDAFRQRLGQ